ncbi:hypothetical protein CSKR_101071 [Clonorchis sinensis]|uniref:Uncharacterized protein n=1 Tax=Clonorchis sinensis TaxID=79923 RepID=A0A3R7G6K4_CLOSI|nr:hypothetical protein CSKR_101071 [Clonorchis sinensis]
MKEIKARMTTRDFTILKSHTITFIHQLLHKASGKDLRVKVCITIFKQPVPWFDSDLSLDFPCLGLGNLAVFQPSSFLLVAWQLGTERVLQPNDLFTYFTMNGVKISIRIEKKAAVFRLKE